MKKIFHLRSQQIRNMLVKNTTVLVTTLACLLSWERIILIFLLNETVLFTAEGRKSVDVELVKHYTQQIGKNIVPVGVIHF